MIPHPEPRLGLRHTALALFLALVLGLLPPADDARAEGPGGYLKLNPDILVNLESEDGGRLLLTTIEVKSKDPETLAQTRHHAAALRHELILLLSAQDAAVVETPDGRRRLQRDALATVNAVMRRETGGRELDALYFSSFVIE